MTTRFIINTLATLLFSLSLTALAHAQVQRTFVSAQRGSDANTTNNCSVANPCRSFGAAVGVVTSGGEVIALDSGGYGAVNITKAVQVTAPTGVYVAITASTGNAITINAGANDVVLLRGLTLNSVDLTGSGGGAGGSTGIDFAGGKAVFIESCVINGFLDFGIYVEAAGEVYVTDTIVRNTVNFDDIAIFTNSGTVIAALDHCHVERSGRNGFNIGNNTVATISDSFSTRNSAVSGAAGFVVTGSGRLILSNSTATHNINGFYAFNGGTFESRGNNTARGNLINNTFGTITIFSGN